MTVVSHSGLPNREILLKKHVRYNVHYGIFGRSIITCSGMKIFFSSGASVHIAGLHLYVFLSPNLNFYACRFKMLNVALFCH